MVPAADAPSQVTGWPGVSTPLQAVQVDLQGTKGTTHTHTHPLNLGVLLKQMMILQCLGFLVDFLQLNVGQASSCGSSVAELDWIGFWSRQQLCLLRRVSGHAAQLGFLLLAKAVPKP